VDPEPQRYPLIPAPAQPLDGPDRFAGLDAAVVDFWRWAFSDLRDNTVRRVLAEYLVAFALGRTGGRRKSWDNCDVHSPQRRDRGGQGLRRPAGLAAAAALAAAVRTRRRSALVG
jgi:hypothetical protein